MTDLYKNLEIHERIFIAAGMLMILTIPLLATGGFYIWLAVKTIYLLGIIMLIRQGLKIKN